MVLSVQVCFLRSRNFFLYGVTTCFIQFTLFQIKLMTLDTWHFFCSFHFHPFEFFSSLVPSQLHSSVPPKIVEPFVEIPVFFPNTDFLIFSDGWTPVLSYTCTCGSGYRISPNDTTTCIDIDECYEKLDFRCNSHDQCINTIGSYECCPDGYAVGLAGNLSFSSTSFLFSKKI